MVDHRGFRGGLVVLLAVGAAALPVEAAGATVVVGCPAGPVVTGGPGPAMEVVDGEIQLTVPTPADGTASYELSTVAVHRGRTPVDLTVVGAVAPDPDTVVTIRKEVVETAQRVTAGVEQSWCFTRLPGAGGDLVVRVSSYVATAKRGNIVPAYPGADAAAGKYPEGVPLHYPDLLDALYQHGIWIDAAGRRWPVTARFVDSAVELTVPSRLLAETTFPATLDPKIVVTPIPG